MIAQTPIVAQLRKAGFASVEGVLEFSALKEPPRLSPALFVAPEREDPQPNRMATGVIDQKVIERFAVAVVIKAARSGAVVSDELHDVTRRISEAIAGWVHPEAGAPCELAGGRLASVDGQHVTWVVSFTTSRHFRKESQ